MYDGILFGSKTRERNLFISELQILEGEIADVKLMNEVFMLEKQIKK